jgi:nucleotide-binding universal stress UspA family protein
MEVAVSYRTLMVHADIGGKNENLFRLAGNLAERFEAKVIGIAACIPPEPIYYADTYDLGAFIEQDRAAIKQRIIKAQHSFRSALEGRCRNTDWRSAYVYESIASYLAREARAADLLLIDRSAGNTELDASRRIAISDLLTAVGRPVLIAPSEDKDLDIGKIVIGWKDTREAQRAVASALPLLKTASHITLVSAAPERELSSAHEAVKDVSGWLKQHGVAPETQVVLEKGQDASQLEEIAKEKNAGLIVAGAYGHSRVREWVLGGVTRELILHSERYAFLSH